MAYATLTDLKARLDITVSTWDTVLQDALDWAQKWVDVYCGGRTFEAGTFTKYYDSDAQDPDDGQLLVVDDDLLTVTGLLNGDDDATILGSATYNLWPRNTSPKWGIRLKSDYAWEWDEDCFVAVTGTWGYTATPDGLVQGVTLRLAEWQYRNKDLIETTTPYSESIVLKKPMSFPSEVETDLRPYRRLA